MVLPNIVYCIKLIFYLHKIVFWLLILVLFKLVYLSLLKTWDFPLSLTFGLKKVSLVLALSLRKKTAKLMKAKLPTVQTISLKEVMNILSLLGKMGEFE
jgi:hypothetical protein